MLALKIVEPEIKSFMQKLLKEPVFESFEVRGVEIVSFTRFEINGIKTAREETDESAKNYCSWQELRPFVLHMIQGGKKPKSVKIIFSPAREETESLHENASALFLNLLYEGDTVLLTTASSQKNFSMDKSMDAAWEDFVSRFLNANGIHAIEAI